MYGRKDYARKNAKGAQYPGMEKRLCIYIVFAFSWFVCELYKHAVDTVTYLFCQQALLPLYFPEHLQDPVNQYYLLVQEVPLGLLIP